MSSEVKSFYKRMLIFFAGLSGVIPALGSFGFWIGYQADRNAEIMKSFRWIHNERGLKNLSKASDLGSAFEFAVFGDIQIGAPILSRLFRVLAREAHVAFVVQTGDAVVRADSAHYRFFLNELAHSGLSLPMLVVPGNHDVRDDSGMLFEQYFGPRQLWFEYGEALFILVDNALGPFDDGQYRWIENVLKGSRVGTKHIFLFMHSPTINWEGDGLTPVEHLYERLFELLRRYNVDYVFMGNWHGYHREARNGTIFVVNGRGGDFDTDARMVSCYSTIVEVKGESIQDRTVELPPSVRMVIKSRLKEFFVAYVGEFAMKNQWFYTCLLILPGLSCVFFVILSKRVDKEGSTRR